MEFKARLNVKFYIVLLLLAALVVFGWYGIYFLNANEILMEDGLPMDSGTKTAFSIAIGVAVISWTLSFVTLLGVAFRGYAFMIDGEGIHNTVTATALFALILIVPVKSIPFASVKNFGEENGLLTLNFDKSQADINPVLRVFAVKRFGFFKSFIKENENTVKAEIKKHLK